MELMLEESALPAEPAQVLPSQRPAHPALPASTEETVNVVFVFALVNSVELFAITPRIALDSLLKMANHPR